MWEPHQVMLKLSDKVMFAWQTHPYDIIGTHGIFILSQTKSIVLCIFYPQSFSMLCKIASNCGLATNEVGCSMTSLHLYPPLRHPPTSLEQRLSIVHLGPDSIQVAPSRGIHAIFSNLMRQPQSVTKWDTFIIWIQPLWNVAESYTLIQTFNLYEMWPRVKH